MGLLPINLIRPGMVLDEDIKKGDNIFVPISTQVTPRVLDVMHKLGVKAAVVASCITPEPRVSDVIVQYDHIVELYKRFFNLAKNYDSLTIKQSTNDIKEVVEHIVTDIQVNNRSFIYDLRDRITDTQKYAHSVNTMLLSVMFGHTLKLDYSELVSIGLSSLFADFGMFMMPTMVWQKPERLTTEDWNVVRRHPRESVNFIRENLNLPFSVNQAILDHHERYDGKGYPEGRKGENISKYARIIMLPDVYDAMTRDNYYRDRIARHESLEYIEGGSGVLFDPDLVNRFARSLVMYPIGCSVHLSDGSIGQVLTTLFSAKRPIVCVYYRNGKLLESCEVVNLNDIHNLNIIITDCYGM